MEVFEAFSGPPLSIPLPESVPSRHYALLFPSFALSVPHCFGVWCACVEHVFPLKYRCQLGMKPIINHRRIPPPPPSGAVCAVYGLRTAKAMMMAWYPNPLQLTPAVILGVWCVSPQQETLVDLLMPFCEYQNERSASWYGHQTSENLEKLLNVVVLVLSSSLATQLAPVVLLLQPLLVLQRIHHHADCVFVQR